MEGGHGALDVQKPTPQYLPIILYYLACIIAPTVLDTFRVVSINLSWSLQRKKMEQRLDIICC
jgi:hypothetical protein